MWAEKFIEQLPEIDRVNFEVMCRSLIMQNYTPIFEFCSRDQRIVLDYPDTMMPLTAMRCNVSGKYVSRVLLEVTGTDYMWSVVDVIDSTDFLSIRALANVVKDWADAEGVVVAFPSGFRVKIKAADYVMKHKALEGLRFEKDVVELILTNKLDDVISFLAKDQQDRLIAFRDAVISNIHKANQNIRKIFLEISKQTTNRAEFANGVKTYPPHLSQFLFGLYSGRAISLQDVVLKSCTNSTRLETMRWAIGPSFYGFK